MPCENLPPIHFEFCPSTIAKRLQWLLVVSCVRCGALEVRSVQYSVACLICTVLVQREFVSAVLYRGGSGSWLGEGHKQGKL